MVRLAPVALAALLCCLARTAAALTAVEAQAELSAKVASYRAFEVTVSAEDLVGGRSFSARVVFEAPDRLALRFPAGDVVLAREGVLYLVEDGRATKVDAGAWTAAALAAVAPAYEDLAAIEGAAGPPAGSIPAGRLEAGASRRRLGARVGIDFRRSRDRVAISLLASYRLLLGIEPGTAGIDVAWSGARHDRGGEETPVLAAADADRVTFRTRAKEAVLDRRTGLPETIRFLSPTGKVEAEVRFQGFAALEAAPPGSFDPPPGVDLAAAEELDTEPELKAELAREVLAAFYGRLLAGEARDPGFLAREDARVEAALARACAGFFRAAYPEGRLREEARRAAEADLEIARSAFERAGPSGRADVAAELRRRFRENAERQLREAADDLVRVAEQAIAAAGAGGEGVGPEAGDEAHRLLVRVTGRAVIAAYRRAIVDPMEAEAAAALEALAGAAAPAEEGTP